MSNPKKEKVGSIYYDKHCKKWRCTYYTYEENSYMEVRKTKSFITEQEAKNFLTSLQCQKGDELYIKNNGIPLNLLLRTIAQKKLEANAIRERSIFKNIV